MTTPTTPAPAAPATNTNVQPQKGPAQGQPAAPPQKFKVADFEFNSPEDAKAEILRGRQSSKLLTESDKRLKEAQEIQKRFEQRKKSARNLDEFSNLLKEELGFSDEEAEEHLAKYLYEKSIKPKQMSPEARRAAELEAENKRLKAERERQLKEVETRKMEELTNREITKLRTEIEQLLTSKKIPGTRHAVSRIAAYLQAYDKAGTEVPLQVAVDRVMHDYRKEFSEILDEATPEQMISFLGEDRWRKMAKKVSQWALGLKNPPQQQQGQEQPSRPQVVEDPQRKRKKISPNDWNIGGI